MMDDFSLVACFEHSHGVHHIEKEPSVSGALFRASVTKRVHCSNEDSRSRIQSSRRVWLLRPQAVGNPVTEGDEDEAD